MLKKTNRQGTFKDLVAQIEGAILDGRLKAGDKLPAQRDLVEMFQTSRGPLREALRVLEQKGLLDVKRGVQGGAVIKRPGMAPVTESLGLLVRHRKITLAELSEFREGVEGNVAGIAARRATPEDIARIKELLEAARRHVETGVNAWELFCRVDNRIHVAIAKAAGNRVYEFVLRMVHDNIQQYYEAHPLKDPQIMQENYQDLCNIVTALEKGQATAVRSLMQSHVRRFNRYMNDPA
jgi:DNA-binding FadR family transcriptional regulator